LAALWLSAAGCRSLQRQGPVPKSVAACRQLQQQGVSAMERGDWQRSEELLNQAVRACPIDADARRRYAETLWHRGAANDAIAQLVEAGRLATEDVGIAVKTGELYLATGQLENARRMADHALEFDPKCAPAWAVRAKTLEAAGDMRQALADYQRALGYDANNPDVLLQVAEIYRRLNQPERALVALQSLIDTHPPGEEPQQLLYLQGLAQTALGRYDDAIESFNLANQRGRPTAELFCRLAEAELLAGRPTNSQIAAQQALSLEPNHPSSRALLERLQLARGGRPQMQR
jgi:tetratricopeptide (TPR) repeat protein